MSAPHMNQLRQHLLDTLADLRRTDAPMWETKLLETQGTTASLPGVRADDWLFGVSALAADGSESPVSSAVPGGQFAPLAKP